MSVVLQTSLFDSVGGLPVHPLVVHAAVVLLPLAALGVVACVLVPPLRRRFGGLTVLVLAAGAASAFVAKASGELLAERVELPREHAFWGGILPWVALALLVAAAVWWTSGAAADRSARPAAPPKASGSGSGSASPERPGSPAGTIAGGIAAILALAVLGLTVAVGHTGATAVWGDLAALPGATPTATPAPAASATPTPADPSVAPTSAPTTSASPASASPASASPASVATPTASAPGRSYTLVEVRQHDSTASCWAVVDGTVYDLTDWISRHPGGAQRILGLCGRDASADFAAQHGSAALPNETIRSFRIGELAR